MKYYKCTVTSLFTFNKSFVIFIFLVVKRIIDKTLDVITERETLFAVSISIIEHKRRFIVNSFNRRSIRRCHRKRFSTETLTPLESFISPKGLFTTFT